MGEWLLRCVASRLITDGHLEIAFPSGRFAMFGNGSGEPVYVRLTDRKAVWHLALHPSLALGELITDGRLQMLHGSIYDLLDLVCRNFAINALPSHSWPNILRRYIASVSRRRNSSRRARKNVAHHYDLNAALYQLFLDKDEQYSCAYFKTPDGDLDRAQLEKKRHIAAKLLPSPNHKVLDIGCGWGGLGIYLAKCCATFVTGITLSKEQLEVAKARVIRDGLEGQVEFRLQDYRDVCGSFDRVVSVGMFEHVGLPDYKQFFASAYRLLDDDGVMLLHTIGRLDGPAPTNAWLEKYIFPGSYAPALSEMLPAIERSGLFVTDVEVLRLHYAQTLGAWRQRFLANRDVALRLYDERFCRMWEFYLAGCEASFRYCGLVVYQVQLAKHIASVPQTRDYIALTEDALTRAEEREHLALPHAAE